MHLKNNLRKICLALTAITINSLCVNAQKITGDSITVAVEPEYNHVTKAHRVLFGENYRKLWDTPVKLKIFHISTEQGGLKIVGLGGGKQTRSLKLVDAAGNNFALRTVQKYPERALPANLRKTIVKDILQDEVSTSHPFSALVVPPLAQALSIPHSIPQIVYVADDPALGQYRKEFANKVYLFEQRDPLDVDDTDNTEKTEKKLEDDNDNKVLQKLVLRARLLDMVIGDWDRHEDQWRWVKDKSDTGITYTPIPRDRDKVFYSTSGIFPWFLSHQFLKSQLQPYRGEIRDIDGWNFNARYFDRYFLNQLSIDDWKEQIADVQQKLTDSLFVAAMKRMPPVIYRMSAAPIIAAFKQRRDDLSKYALTYYAFLSHMVDVPATNKQEDFTINESDSGKVAITIRKIKKSGEIDKVIYQRTFDPKVTEEVRLYGLKGKDVFHVSGNTPSPIKVRMIGGPGVDSFYVDKQLNNRNNIYVYDRSDQQNGFPSKADAKLRLGKDTSVNYFNRTAFKYNNTSPLVSLGYNTDNGVTLIGGLLIEKQGFRKEPYASHQTILAGYTVERNAFSFAYVGDFKKALGNNDLNVNITSRGPHNVSNFFGIGNETVFINKDPYDINYYRNRYNTLDADVRMFHTNHDLQLSIGATGQFYYASATENNNHFLRDYEQAHPDQNVFKKRFYAGVIGGLRYDTRNNLTNPTSGVYWNTTLNGVTGISDYAKSYAKLQTEFNFYFNPDQDSVLVIANRIGGGTILGHAEYFQQMAIGGPSTLRGFHTFRFAGRTSVYNNFEVRLKLFNFNSYLFPGTVGLIGFNDMGRVWVPGESSNKWHDGYGGGIYLIPAQALIAQVAVGGSTEGALTYLTLGYRF
ncbi:BamA/TamA family outer membrane protein [Mucilaginibacter sp. KACC 22063]|uniref:BamA/TamA family outer membrane protein n=1 Tax=Mucilaginibacter sp. KACC 22063 TaxID=3025666 RepID=UPI0023652B30|nr:BamA/TamA family outer membrane protein [Mucilaginibacter sp. KACC 22063]WDF56195.1 BamA/TamA family outer membrane protein [Mucilaginibacter sp. KACC 22063]